jgi:hypothetical protein
VMSSDTPTGCPLGCRSRAVPTRRGALVRAGTDALTAAIEAFHTQPAAAGPPLDKAGLQRSVRSRRIPRGQ